MQRQETSTDECGLCKADAIAVAGYRGVAFYALGHPVESEEVWVDSPIDCNAGGEGRACDRGHDGECDPGYWSTEERVHSEQIVCVMVGDDRRHVVDVDDCKPMAREDYCGECGQVGCTHDGLERESVTA